MSSGPGTPPSAPAPQNRGDRPRRSASSTRQSYRSPRNRRQTSPARALCFHRGKAMRHPRTIAGRADKDLAMTDDRAAIGIGAELGDPLDVLRGGQIDFAMVIVFAERTPIRQPLLGFGGHIAHGCPPHDGQSAAHAAVAETTRDKRMLPNHTAVPRGTPAIIFLNPVEGCRLAFIAFCSLAVISLPHRSPRVRFLPHPPSLVAGKYDVKKPFPLPWPPLLAGGQTATNPKDKRGPATVPGGGDRRRQWRGGGIFFGRHSPALGPCTAAV